MQFEYVILILFVIASIVAVLAKRLNLPYTIALMAVGLVLGTLNLLEPPHLSKELLYAIFLPPLIYEAAIHIDLEDLRKDFWTIFLLVVPGVILSTLVSAAILVWLSQIGKLQNIPWSLGILFGAAVAATDPIAVVALFKRLGAPKRLRFLIEGESLLNDGTSIVVFTIALEFFLATTHSIESAAVEFTKVVGFGIFIGAIVGILAAVSLRRIDDAMIAITITTVAAFASFLVADRLGASGVMSTVAAGLLTQDIGISKNAFASIKLTIETFWEYIAFAMNSLIFLLMGFTIKLDMLFDLWPVILVAYLAVLVARFFVVGGTWALLWPTSMRFPFGWALVLWWGGLRGALSMVLALSLPEGFAFKDLIVTLVFGVVLLSIFVQGLTMPLVLQLLKIAPAKILREYELYKTRIALIHAAIDKIQRYAKQHIIDPKTAEKLTKEYESKLSSSIEALGKLQPDREVTLKEEFLRIKRRLLLEQKEELLELYRSGAVSYEIYKELQSKLDEELFTLENQGV